jgi:hypothetical protein
MVLHCREKREGYKSPTGIFRLENYSTKKAIQYFDGKPNYLLKTNGLMTPTQISTIRMSKELLMQNHMRTYC